MVGLGTNWIFCVLHTYISIRWAVVGPTAREGVIVNTDDVGAVELLQDAHQCSAVPVVRHTTTIVALACQVAHCCKGNLLDVTEGAFIMVVCARGISGNPNLVLFHTWVL